MTKISVLSDPPAPTTPCGGALTTRTTPDVIFFEGITSRVEEDGCVWTLTNQEERGRVSMAVRKVQLDCALGNLEIVDGRFDAPAVVLFDYCASSASAATLPLQLESAGDVVSVRFSSLEPTRRTSSSFAATRQDEDEAAVPTLEMTYFGLQPSGEQKRENALGVPPPPPPDSPSPPPQRSPWSRAAGILKGRPAGSSPLQASRRRATGPFLGSFF